VLAVAQKITPMLKAHLRSLSLTALLLLTLVPGILALLLTTYGSYERERHAADQDLLGRVRAMNQLVDQQLLSVQRNLELLAATSDELARGDLSGVHRKMLAAQQAMPLLGVLQLYDPAGQILLSTSEPFGTRLPRTDHAARKAAVAATGRTAIGDIVVGTVTKKVLIPVDVPVRVNGTVTYVLTAGIYAEHINALLANQIFPEGWIAVIYDRQGTIAGRKLNPETFIGKKVAPQVLEWLEGPAERLGEGRTLEGRMSVAAMSRSAQTGYSVTASVPEAVLEGPLRQALLINTVAVLASLGLGVFMAWRFAQSMRRSIQELELATESVASGHTHEVVPTGATAELARLSQRFNSMVGALQEARAAQQRYEQELEHAASHDPLTGLANRMLVVDRIERAVTQARRNQRQVAVMLLDLDRFKVINDTLTHGSGDMVLIEVAQRLSRQVRDIDTVARLGGDEFLVVLSDITSEADASMLADALLKALAQPLLAKGHELTISGSLGIALAPRDGELPSDLIMHADIAMYRAKENGREQFEFFSVDMNARLSQRIELETGLRRSLDHDQLVLYYQPRCDIATGRIVGVEALIRWKHPVDGLVPPGKFIPVAEETGLIVPIGEWVLKTACVDARRWQEQGLGPLVVGVNVSARQFQSGKLAQVVDQQLQFSGLPPELLELELTESAVMNDPQRTLQVLHDIKAIGARVALDDFGTGYSSLGYLKRFPVDCLKIDQSFVRDITVDPEDAAIARMVITLGHSLRQEVIAEGVETHAQLQYLREQGCDMVQGYLFSPPVPVDEFEDMVRRGRRLPT